MANTTEPEKFTQGTTQTWTISDSTYSPVDGWALTYEFSGPAVMPQLTGIANGGSWDLTIAAATTASLQTGVYYYQAFVELSGVIHQIREGQFTLEQSLLTTNDFDGRTQSEVILDAINAQLQGTASNDQKKYKIGDVEIEKFTPADLLTQRDYWTKLVVKDKRRERLRKGQSTSRTIKTRFTG